MGDKHSYTVARPAELVRCNHCLDAGCLSLSEDAGVDAAVFPLDANHLQKAAFVKLGLQLARIDD